MQTKIPSNPMGRGYKCVLLWFRNPRRPPKKERKMQKSTMPFIFLLCGYSRF
uniref:Uncharacterized protein n=1 Tax=Anguilla anguilla TaxID=7936 RepID=A0A0E9PVV9_ANGAN